MMGARPQIADHGEAQSRSATIVPLSHRIEDAARVIGVSRSTLFAIVAEGRLPARKIGRATVILHSDLQAFVEAAPLADATKRAQSSSK